MGQIGHYKKVNMLPFLFSIKYRLISIEIIVKHRLLNVNLTDD